MLALQNFRHTVVAFSEQCSAGDGCLSVGPIPSLLVCEFMKSLQFIEEVREIRACTEASGAVALHSDDLSCWVVLKRQEQRRSAGRYPGQHVPRSRLLSAFSRVVVPGPTVRKRSAAPAVVPSHSSRCRCRSCRSYHSPVVQLPADGDRPVVKVEQSLHF